MFPFYDLQGQVVGFTGRSLITQAEIKYLNSREVDGNPYGFRKGRELFGLYQAKTDIIRTDKVYLVEGNIDVITLHRIGLSNTVCGSGTALTEQQARLLKRFCDTVVMIYDGDEAGIKASIRNIEVAIAAGLDVKMVSLPTGKDPDDFFRKMSFEDAQLFLKKTEKNFVKYTFDVKHKDFEENVHSKSLVLGQLADAVARCPDRVAQRQYMRWITEVFSVDSADVNAQRKPMEIKPEASILGFDEDCQQAIRTHGRARLFFDQKLLVEDRLDNIENSLYLNPEQLDKENIRRLRTLCDKISIMMPSDVFFDSEKKCFSPKILACEQLLDYRFNVTILMDGEDGDQECNFYDIFYKICDALLRKTTDTETVKLLTEKSAELMAKADPTIQALQASRFQKLFGLTKASFEKIMKPFVAIQKSAESESLKLDGITGWTMQNLPEYVDNDFFMRWGYFPVEDINGKKIYYAFRNDDYSIRQVGNFYMEPMFHVKSAEEAQNKRIVRISSAIAPTIFSEITSAVLVNITEFRKWFLNLGPYVFISGKGLYLETIINSNIEQYKECYEFRVYGWQHEGFYAFSNAVVHNNQVTHTDELGMVTVDGKTYYSPSHSKMFEHLRKDEDRYAQDRHFVYRAGTHTSFEEWSTLMDKVYKMNNNGKWAVVFAIMSAFRSTIYPINRLFTSLFFLGPTDSGKSQIAISIRSLFVSPEAPLFNLNSGTDAAFFTILERLRDVPVIFEEYNDYQISDVKFQGLKAAVYDGEGKQKRKDASSKEMDISQVNSVPILLGQEFPERDDNALANRCVACHVPKKDDWTDQETEVFADLKERQKSGLSHILVEILKQRPMIEEYFKKHQRRCEIELKDEFRKDNQEYQTRVVNTISMFLATVSIWEEHVAKQSPQLKLPFTYLEFKQLAKDKIIEQSRSLFGSNRLSIFFDTIQTLLFRNNGLMIERDFKIRDVQRITVERKDNLKDDVEFEQPVKLLFLRFNNIYPLYKDIQKNEALKPTALKTYFKDHPTYVGYVDNSRFSWNEIKEIQDPLKNYVSKQSVSLSNVTSAYVFLYTDLGLDLEQHLETKTEESKVVDFSLSQTEIMATKLPF